MKDYLIAGQGIAGSLLALELIKRGHRVTVADPSPERNATNTAAGTYNPITGQRWVRTWKDTTLLPYAQSYYASFEHEFGKTVHYSTPILRFLKSEEDHTTIHQKSEEDPIYKKYIQSTLTAEQIPHGLVAPWGAVRLQGGGWVNTHRLTQILRQHFSKLGVLTQEAIQHEDLVVKSDLVIWKGKEFHTLIFCEGFRVMHNPWFKAIPWRHAKGEALIVEIKGLDTADIINAGAFILPLGNNRFKVGATYEWKELDEQPTEHGKNQLLEKISKICNLPITILDHSAAVRPIAFDRAPVTGHHPDYPRLALLNGFGSKGVLYAPYYSKQLADHLDHGHPIDDKASVATHWKPERNT